jgi:hypothetical protein
MRVEDDGWWIEDTMQWRELVTRVGEGMIMIIGVTTEFFPHLTLLYMILLWKSFVDNMHFYLGPDHSIYYSIETPNLMVGEPVTCIFILDHSIYYSIETPNLMVGDSSKEGSLCYWKLRTTWQYLFIYTS